MTVSTVIHRNMSTMQRTTIMISNYRCRSVCCYTNRSTHYTGCDTVTAIVSVMGWRQNLNSCRVLVSSSWFVGVDFCSESSMVSYIVYLPMDAPAVCETVASLDAVSTISGLFTMLFAVVILDAVAKSVRLGMMMYLLEKSTILNMMLINWRQGSLQTKRLFCWKFRYMAKNHRTLSLLDLLSNI